ncbi:glycosyltransferase family 4 protein [Microbispora sp. CA-102843]|uniref:glycosyltransferase family 4 protein n=1 Tax=Microbispora sp. CA-102843 TaxID=3239952 RepID=UPI003D8A3DA0
MIRKDAATPGGRKKVVYVVPHLSGDESEHFAHVPALLESLGARTDLVALVERGAPPSSLPGVHAVCSVAGHRRAARFLGYIRAIHRLSRSGYRTYFLRYSRFLLVALIVTYPLYRPRILLWRSGTADLLEPGATRSLRARLDDTVNYALSRCVHGFVTGPEAMVPVMRARWRIPHRKMRLLYNDIDGDRFAPPSPADRAETRRRLGWREEEFVVLFVHRLSFRRGTRLLAPLLRAVRGRLDRPVRLVVAGDGPDRALLERLAAGEPGLEILGAVPNRDLPPLYGAADCFLMPSYEEGFPRVLLEAMSTALPIVTTRAGGSADVVGPGYPYLCDTGDLDGLAAGTAAVACLPPSEREALGARLRHRARERFSPQCAARMLEEIL